MFGSVMGLAGLSSAWRLAHRMYGMPLWIAQLIGVLAVLAFLMIGFGYAMKWVTGPDAVKAEFNHPIAGNLFGTLFISLLLLPIPLADLSVPLAGSVSCAERYADHAPGPITHGIAIFLLATVTPLLLVLAARTLWGVLRGELEALAH
ncbi:hypothetical protein M3A49_38555 [Paraburkholderia sp. CNPSo 3076]|nr:hypothetical protein [Paraburkholderia sp. CNPSo 3076]